MKRYEQGSIGMRPDPEGLWCDYAEAQAEIERLRVTCTEHAEIEQHLSAEIERLRGLLHECLSFALGAPIGWSSDLWERVTETLGE